MANSINTSTKMWRLDESDIITTIPICIRKLQMKATAAADEAHFYSLPGGSDATSDSNGFYTFDVTNTASIQEVGGVAPWGSAAQNDWVHISNCSTTANDGWYWLSTKIGSTKVGIENGTNALSNSTGQTGQIAIYTPTECMTITGDTPPSSSVAFTHPYPLDWGDKGRWFENLSFYEATGDSIDIYCYIR